MKRSGNLPKKLRISVTVILILGGIILPNSGCVKQTNDSFRIYRNTPEYLSYIKSRVLPVTGNELDDKLQNKENFILLDVRDLQDFLTFPITEAEHIARGNIELKIEKEFPDKEKEYVLLCTDGIISLLAADALLRIGYKNVKYLKDGLIGWGKIIPESSINEKKTSGGSGCM